MSETPDQPYPDDPSAPTDGPVVGAPRPYTQVLRTPALRWWRPLVALGISVGGGLVLVIVFGLALGAAALLWLPPEELQALATPEGAVTVLANWWGFLLNNLLLAALIPLSTLSVWAAYRSRPRWMSSVEGGVRWGWLARCSLVALVVLGFFIGGSLLLSPPPAGDGGGWGPALALLAVVLLTTPLQAAGEEYFFRGWLGQVVGSWFARPVVGVVIGGVISATLFALAHGGQNVWLFADRFAFGVVASVLVWRTGGLEAAIAVHAVNNMVILVPTALTGGLAGSLTVTDIGWELLAVDVVMLTLVVLVIDRLARRSGVRRVTPSAPLWSTGPDPVESSLGAVPGNALRSGS